MDERIDEGVLRWFGYVVRRENDRIAKRSYVGVCDGNRSVVRPQKRWIDTVKERLRKRDLGVRQARRRVNDRSVLLGFLGGVARRMNP